jgi:hypothetical protein
MNLSRETVNTSGGIAVLSSSAYHVHDSAYIVGELRNDTGKNVEDVRIEATLYDSTGAFVGTCFGSAIHQILVPGGISPFIVHAENAVGYDRHALRVTYSETVRQPVPSLPILSVRAIDYFGFSALVGEMQNTSPHSLESVQVIATFYDHSGCVINVAHQSVHRDLLGPDQKSPFRVPLYSGPTAYADRVLSTDARHTTEHPPGLRCLRVTHFVDEWGDLRFEGEVENNGVTEARFSKVTVTLYDVRGDVVNGDYTYTSPTHIQPGETATFGLKFHDNWEAWTTYAIHPLVITVPTATATAALTSTPPTPSRSYIWLPAIRKEW